MHKVPYEDIKRQCAYAWWHCAHIFTHRYTHTCTHTHTQAGTHRNMHTYTQKHTNTLKRLTKKHPHANTCLQQPRREIACGIRWTRVPSTPVRSASCGRLQVEQVLAWSAADLCHQGEAQWHQHNHYVKRTSSIQPVCESSRIMCAHEECYCSCAWVRVFEPVNI